MRKFVSILYLPLILIANNVHASEADKLHIYSAPRAAVVVPVETEAGDETQLSESDAKLRVVNLWALWCVSCRKEMPTLDALSEEFSPEELRVLAVAVGRNDPEKVHQFFDEIGVKNIENFYDKKQKYAGAIGAAALPHTIFLNAKGEEVARVIGEADYTDEALKEKIHALLDAQEK